MTFLPQMHADKAYKKCNHEYREILRGTINDTSTNLQFYCIHCLKITCLDFYTIDRVVRNPKVERI